MAEFECEAGRLYCGGMTYFCGTERRRFYASAAMGGFPFETVAAVVMAAAMKARGEGFELTGKVEIDTTQSCPAIVSAEVEAERSI